MHLYYIVSRIFLILSIMDFAVAAPVPVQEKPRERVDVVNTPEDAMTILGKRGDDLYELFLELFGRESSAAHPSSSPPQSGPANDGQPLPSIPKEPSQVSSIDRALPSLGDEWNKMWRNLIESHFPAKQEKSSAARPSSSSQPLGPAGGPTDVEQPLPHIDEEPLPVSSHHHVPLSLGNEWNKMWRNLIESHFLAKQEKSSSVAHLQSSSQPSVPTDVSPNVEQPLSSFPKEPSQVASSLNLGSQWNKMWRNLIESHFPAKLDMSSATRPSLSPQPLGPADESMDVEKPLPSILEESPQVPSPDNAKPSTGSLTESGYELMKGGSSGPASSTMSSADHGLMEAHTLPDPGQSAESDREMMEVLS